MPVLTQKLGWDTGKQNEGMGDRIEEEVERGMAGGEGGTIQEEGERGRGGIHRERTIK